MQGPGIRKGPCSRPLNGGRVPIETGGTIEFVIESMEDRQVLASFVISLYDLGTILELS